MTALEIPNLHRFKNRHGRWQTYYRAAGRNKIRIHAEYLSPEFWQEYEAAKAGAPRPEIGAGRSRPGTFNGARTGYYASAEFLGLAPGGQRTRRNILEHWFLAYGDGPVKDLQRKHLRDGALHVKPQKTGGPVLVIPVVPELAAAIEATPSNNMTFLVTRTGAPFTAAGFGNHFREWCNEAGRPHCSAHGLRKAICRRLAEAGCSTLQIAAITGHKTSRLVDHYTAARDQALLARAAMATITGT
jgi:integrase